MSLRSNDYLTGYKRGYEAGRRRWLEKRRPPKEQTDSRTREQIAAEFDNWIDNNKMRYQHE